MKEVHTSMKALITRGDEFLMVKEDLGQRIYWDLPGGAIEYGETPEEALQRELQEETGLEVNVERPAGLYWFYTDEDVQYVCNVFHCTVRDGVITVGENPSETENIIGHEWLTLDDFEDRDLAEHPSMASLLRTAL